VRDYYHYSGEVSNAIDFNIAGSADFGTPALASFSGTVVSAKYNGGYGNEVVVDHGGGWKSRVAHLSAFSVGVGQVVQRGQELGKVGSTGNSSGPHLHYEQIADGIRVPIVIDGVAMIYDGLTHQHTSNNCAQATGGREGSDGVIVLSSGAIAMYRVGSDGNVWGASQAVMGGSFGAWQQLSWEGDYVGRPAVIQVSNGAIALYARTRGGTIRGASQSVAGGAFSGWGQVGGGGVASDPAVKLLANGTIAIYVTSTLGNVSGTSQSTVGGSFPDWGQLSWDGDYVGRPAVVQVSNGAVALYARTRGGVVRGASQSVAGGAFSAWGQIAGGGVVSDPRAVLAANGCIAIYVDAGAGYVSGVSQSTPGGPFGTEWQPIGT